MQEMLQREKESEYYKEWEEQEDQVWTVWTACELFEWSKICFLVHVFCTVIRTFKFSTVSFGTSQTEVKGPHPRWTRYRDQKQLSPVTVSAVMASAVWRNWQLISWYHSCLTINYPITIYYYCKYIFIFFSLAAKPIDLLAQYISTEVEDLDIQMHEPYRILVVCICTCTLDHSLNSPYHPRRKHMNNVERIWS